MITTLRRMLRHDFWANESMAQALAALPTPPPKAARWMAHIVGAEALWLARLTGQESALAVWPELTPAQCLDHLARHTGAWEAVLAPGESGMLRVVGYVNSQGEEWKNTVGDIFHHVMLHSSYHRGQIASELRAAGHGPPYTDYIHAVRQGLVP